MNGKSLEKIGKRPFALWIGVITPLKKPLEVLDIARAVPDIDFIMIGSPLDKSIVNRLMAEKPPNLYYLGPVPDPLKKELIQKCSVGLTTSRYEGFGWTPFEFLTEGKPVLAYRLEVFKEVYGDLLIYACNITDFIKHLKEMYSDGFKVNIDREAIHQLRTKYDFGRAASKIVRRLKLKSLTIFTRDIPIDSDVIAGFYLVDWKLWKSLKDSGTRLQILANGMKYSEKFGLTTSTRLVGRKLLPIKKKLESIDQVTNLHDKVKRKILRFTLLLLEPLSFVETYIKEARRRGKSDTIIATGEPQIFAGIILKFIFRLKLVCLLHDTRFYRFLWGKTSFFMKIYYLFFTYCLRHVDHIIVVSKKSLEELTNFYPHLDRLMILWE